jgi:hypothetical protein
MSDTGNFRNHGTSFTGFVDVLSTLFVSPTYSGSAKGAGTFSVTVPMTLEVGLEGGVNSLREVHSEGSLNQIYGRFHLDIFRLISVGGGFYHVDLPEGVDTTTTDVPLSAASPGQKTQKSGWGGFYGVQLETFPNSRFKPFFDVRWYGEPMPGHIVMFGIKYELDRDGM